MPRMSHSGWFSGPWAFCHCHQRQYPVSMLRRQDGLLVCPSGFDNPQRTRTVDRRQQQIAAVLGDGQDEGGVAEILKNPQSDDMP